MDLTEKKLERAEKEAEAKWKEMYEPEPPKEEPATPAPEAEAVEETPEAPNEEVKEKAKEETAEVIAEETTETPKKEEPKKEEPKPEPKSDDYKQKYQTLEGKYKAEVPRLSAEINQWKEYAVSLQNRVTALEEAAKKPVKKDEPDPDIDSVAESYPDVSKVIKKMQAKHEAEIAALKEQIESGVSAEVKAVREDLNLTKQDRFDLAMRTLAGPDWRTTDQDPAFIGWLQERVPYTKATKLDLLQAAARSLDAETVAQFFTDFKEATKSEVIEIPPRTMDKFTAPPRSGGLLPPTRSAQPGPTRTQYEKFMDPRYRFNPKDWGGKTETQVEEMFDNAISKGTLY